VVVDGDDSAAFVSWGPNSLREFVAVAVAVNDHVNERERADAEVSFESTNAHRNVWC
jgi:hypothetical protein